MHRHLVLAGAIVALGCGPSDTAPQQNPTVAAAPTSAAKPRDESDPMTHVADLKVTAKRPAAVGRLVQFYEDAMTKDKNERGGPTVKPLLDKIVVPMHETCVDPSLEPSLRTTVVKFLADARDARAEDCFKKTLEGYKPDQTEGDVQNVMGAIAAMKQASLAPDVMKVFTSLSFSKPNTKLMARDVANAVIAVAGPAQEAKLLELLEAPIDTKVEATAQDQIYWQTVAVEALGRMKSEKAVRPLLKIVLTTSKAPIATVAMIALVSIGKPSVAATEALLKGEDKELAELAKAERLLVVEKDKDGKIPPAVEKAAEMAYVPAAAQVLGALGAESSVGTLLELHKKADPETKAVIALVFPNLPRSKETFEAYQKTFEGTKLELELRGGGRAKELLAEGASDLYDARVAPWIAGAVAGLKGTPEDVDAVRQRALVAAMKTMRLEDVAAVEKLVKLEVKGADEAGKPTATAVGKATEKEWELAKKLVEGCEAKIDCYVAKLSDEKTQEPAEQFAGIKAAYMLAILGDDSTRTAIVDAIPKIQNPSIRDAALKALKALAPKGDEAAATKLLEYLEKARAAKDDMLTKQYEVFTQVAASLRARGQ